jgi:hypothetical protein
LFQNAFRILDTDAASKVKKLAILLDPETDEFLGEMGGGILERFWEYVF